MFYPGPPPPVVDSRLNKDQSRMEKGGELLPAHKTALVQVFKILMLSPSVMFLPKFNFQSLYLKIPLLQVAVEKMDGMVGLEYVIEV